MKTRFDLDVAFWTSFYTKHEKELLKSKIPGITVDPQSNQIQWDYTCEQVLGLTGGHSVDFSFTATFSRGNMTINSTYKENFKLPVSEISKIFNDEHNDSDSNGIVIMHQAHYPESGAEFPFLAELYTKEFMLRLATVLMIDKMNKFALSHRGSKTFQQELENLPAEIIKFFNITISPAPTLNATAKPVTSRTNLVTQGKFKRSSSFSEEDLEINKMIGKDMKCLLM